MQAASSSRIIHDQSASALAIRRLSGATASIRPCSCCIHLQQQQQQPRFQQRQRCSSSQSQLRERKPGVNSRGHLVIRASGAAGGMGGHGGGKGAPVSVMLTAGLAGCKALASSHLARGLAWCDRVVGGCRLTHCPRKSCWV